MGTWAPGEAGRGRRMSACHTRTHTPGLGTACGSKCERACAAVSVRVSECVICVSASAIVWGWERAAGRGGGCGRCPRGRPRLGWGGCRRRRGLGGCQGGRVVSRGVWRGGWVPAAGPGPQSAQSSLPLSSPPRRASVCVCVLGASLGTRGSLSHLPRRRRRCLWLPTLGGDSGATGEAPGEGAGRAGRPRPPTSPGRGCRSPLRSLLFGAPRLPLSPCSRPSVRLGVGMSQRRPPLPSHGNLGGGDEAPPPPRERDSKNSGGCWGLTPRSI